VRRRAPDNGRARGWTQDDDALLLRRPRLPRGFRVSGVACGLKTPGRARQKPLDLALIVCDRRPVHDQPVRRRPDRRVP